MFCQDKAKQHNVSMEKVHIIGLVDFNSPNASSKCRVADLSKALNTICEMNPLRNVGILDFPDQPKASSKRGLADEEYDIQTAMWSMKLHVDTRFILPFDFHPHSESVSKRRTVDQVKTKVQCFCAKKSNVFDGLGLNAVSRKMHEADS